MKSYISIKKILERKHFEEAEIVAGEKGLGHQIKWVHVVESIQISNLLKGSELILSTGLGWKEEPEQLFSFVRQLIDCHAAGLCIEMNTYIKDIPQNVIDLANSHQFPIILFHKEVLFVEITHDIHSLIINNQYQLLSDLEQYSQILNKMIIEIDQHKDVLLFLQKYLDVQVFAVFHSGKIESFPNMTEKLKQQVLNRKKAENNERSITKPVQIFGDTYAEITIVSTGRLLNDFDSLILDRTTTVLGQFWLRDLYVSEKRIDSEKNWLTDWIEGELREDVLVEQLSKTERSSPFTGAVVWVCKVKDGTDTAGSGRVPAALNDLVGLKPSLGAWPTKGVVPACASLDCVTVFSHSLEEAYKVDAIARGLDQEDPWSRDLANPQAKLPKKICLPKDDLTFYGPFAKEYKKAWDGAVKQIKQLKIQIEYIDYQFFAEAAAILYDGPFVAERWADLGGFITEHPEVTFPVTEKVLRSGSQPQHDAASVFHSMHKLQEFKLKNSKLLQDAVLVTPTAGGTWTRDQVREDPIKTNSDMGLYTNHCNLLDLCAVAVQAGEAAVNLPFGITFFALSQNEGLIEGAAETFVNKMPAKQETTLVAVCGLHMRGFPLEKQMLEFGATFVREAVTAEKYQFVKLATEPAKPGLIKKPTGGKAIELEIWEMPLSSFGAFAALIPAPLGIGKVELQDGVEVPGFICEGYASEEAENISDAGSWRKILSGI
ncbi:PucR family transcriptional regulator ligand-binding domain-containing protein [Bacillus sp. AFS040349]|uniref:allophanate hydrolase-related protein n=1 Tax=Bacillus sp. AFS040349 TaxID=2033502 RepID=UPI00159BD651|nr:PucR family transcriptional regulator ligand-binding domain-containing protein [Bacillus sp. AFS040349]